VLAMPETPRWLAKHGQGSAAQKVLARIRGTQNIQAEYAEIQDTISQANELGISLIFWLLIAEIYPLKIRGIAEGTAAGTNWAANLLVSLTFLSLVQALGPSWTFWLYGLLSIGSLLFSYFVVPETKDRTLEEIERTLRSKWSSSLHQQ
jgi:hypothetical protein